jgi:hypothetical protein
MNGVAYSLPELFLITRRFNEGKGDLQIASELMRHFGRKCGSEAVRKVRRTLGLKKVPTYERWEWQPDVTAAGGLDELAMARRDNRRHVPCKYVTVNGKRQRVYLYEEAA